MPKPIIEVAPLIDQYYIARQKRLEAQRAVDDQKEVEDKLKVQITEALHLLKLEGARGKVASASFKRTLIPKVVDEDALLDWGKLKNNRAFVKVSIGAEQFRELLAEGRKVPGVEQFIKEELSFNKVGAS